MFYEESKIQEAFVRWVKIQHPRILFTCAPATAKNARQGAMNKRMGFCKGWPDLFFAHPSKAYYGLFIEFKTVGGSEHGAQKEVRDHLNGIGYKSVVCRSFEEAVKVVEEYISV